MFKSIDLCIKEIKENYVSKNEYGVNYNKFESQYRKKPYLPHIISKYTPNFEEEVKEEMKLFASYFLNNIERRFAYNNDIVK